MTGTVALYSRLVTVGGEQCAEARLGRGATPSSCLVAAVVVTVALAVSQSPSCHWLLAPKRRPNRWNGSVSQQAVLVVGGRRGCPKMLATPFVALSGCPVAGVPVSRLPVSGLLASGVRAPCVRVRPVRAGVGTWSVGAAGQRPAVGRAGFGVIACPCPRAAGCLPGWPWWQLAAVVGAGESTADLAAVLGCARAAAASAFDRLADQGQPGAGQGGSSGGWGSRSGRGLRATFARVGRAARRSSCVAQGQVRCVMPSRGGSAQRGDDGAWSLGWPGPGHPALGGSAGWTARRCAAPPPTLTGH
jgi:hypothetical protein